MERTHTVEDDMHLSHVWYTESRPSPKIRVDDRNHAINILKIVNSQ